MPAPKSTRRLRQRASQPELAAAPRGLSLSTNGRDSGHYDRKLENILRQAAAAFCARGYHHASIRDIARATRVSLAGLYYYFSSKEELLYLIQRHAFETLLRAARAELLPLQQAGDAEERLRSFIRLHLQFFLEHPNEMKVLTHEEEWLAHERRRDVRAIKKAYYRLCLDQVEALKRERGLGGLNTRLAVLSLFGMMNWIYTWYNPKVDPGAAACAEEMAGIFLGGILGSARGTSQRARVGAERLKSHSNGNAARAADDTLRVTRSDTTRAQRRTAKFQ